MKTKSTSSSFLWAEHLLQVTTKFHTCFQFNNKKIISVHQQAFVQTIRLNYNQHHRFKETFNRIALLKKTAKFAKSRLPSRKKNQLPSRPSRQPKKPASDQKTSSTSSMSFDLAGPQKSKAAHDRVPPHRTATLSSRPRRNSSTRSPPKPKKLHHAGEGRLRPKKERQTKKNKKKTIKNSSPPSPIDPDARGVLRAAAVHRPNSRTSGGVRAGAAGGNVARASCIIIAMRADG